jgi:hypothetical protein
MDAVKMDFLLWYKLRRTAQISHSAKVYSTTAGAPLQEENHIKRVVILPFLVSV